MTWKIREYYPALFSLLWAACALFILWAVVTHGSPDVVIAFVAWVGGIMTPTIFMYLLDRGDDRHV